MVSMAMLSVKRAAPMGTSHATAGKRTPWKCPTIRKPPVEKQSPSMSPTHAT
jgi:hypothetical protein